MTKSLQMKLNFKLKRNAETDNAFTTFPLMKKLILIHIVSFFIFGCTTSNSHRQRVSQDEINQLGLGKYTNPIVCKEPADVKNHQCYYYQCRTSASDELECYKYLVDYDHLKSKAEMASNEFEKDSKLKTHSAPCIYVQNYGGDLFCSSMMKTKDQFITTACIGSLHTRAPSKLRGLCSQKTCEDKNTNCITKGNDEVFTWVFKKE